jgi:hypothetical protein
MLLGGFWTKKRDYMPLSPHFPRLGFALCSLVTFDYVVCFVSVM